MLRPEIIERLVSVAAQAMVDEAGVTEISTSEVFSAYMTMAMHAIRYFKKAGADVGAMRSAVEQLYAELPLEERVM